MPRLPSSVHWEGAAQRRTGVKGTHTSTGVVVVTPTFALLRCTRADSDQQQLGADGVLRLVGNACHYFGSPTYTFLEIGLIEHNGTYF